MVSNLAHLGLHLSFLHMKQACSRKDLQQELAKCEAAELELRPLGPCSSVRKGRIAYCGMGIICCIMWTCLSIYLQHNRYSSLVQKSIMVVIVSYRLLASLQWPVVLRWTKLKPSNTYFITVVTLKIKMFGQNLNEWISSCINDHPGLPNTKPAKNN